jgi:hypothetical protein
MVGNRRHLYFRRSDPKAFAAPQTRMLLRRGERVRPHPPRFARLATTAASSVSSTGFGTCIW